MQTAFFFLLSSWELKDLMLIYTKDLQSSCIILTDYLQYKLYGHGE